MPLVQTRGAASAQGFGEFAQAAVAANYIEDVFSTWLYTGTGALQTITNGIDLSTKGGLVWLKSRSATYNHYLQDTTRGIQNTLTSNDTSAQSVGNDIVNSVSTTGFVVQSYSGGNNSGSTYASWTFREQPKFFDVVTWTGNGTAGRQIPHNLGSTPGCIMVKRTSGSEAGGVAGYWIVYHQGLSTPQSGAVFLNTTDGRNGTSVWNNTAPTSTVFTVGDSYVNYSGDTYVAFIFAHNAGGFGLTGTDNVISCGSYTGNGLLAGPVVTLGYEPQWVLVKRTDSTGNWMLQDNMRSLSQTNTDTLFPNLSNAATTGAYPTVVPTATGFYIGDNGTGYNASGGTYSYIAIRRGPMKVPTLGTSVLAAVTRSGNSTQTIVTGASSPPDLVMVKSRNNATEFAFTDRLRGVTQELSSAYTFSEADFGANPTVSINMNGWTAPAGYGTFNQSGYTYVDYLLSRYPNVFDEVCYTGTGISGQTYAHNLGVVPELFIVKRRDSITNWTVYSQPVGATARLRLNTVAEVDVNSAVWNNTAPTASVFTVGTSADSNASSATYVNYLFATCPGVSKVGSYTGNGSSQTINCGFTTGARFVLIKRTDATGAWYVYDTARGMTVLTDPYLLLNSTAAEVATLGSVTTVSTGFALNSAILADINVSAGTYIFLAIA